MITLDNRVVALEKRGAVTTSAISNLARAPGRAQLQRDLTLTADHTASLLSDCDALLATSKPSPEE